MTGDIAVPLDKVCPEDQGRNVVDDEGVVESICDPGEEGVHFEEKTALGKLIELRIAVEKAGADELVKDSQDKGRKNGEEDVIEG